MNQLLLWLDDRTGYRKLLHEALFERIPGGARWRYVWGSTLLFTFSIQVITGLFLWTAYSPSSQSAWESVYFIQYHMQLGWFVRGLHHFTAQTMIVLLVLHVVQVVLAGAYRPPRELNWWTGLLILFAVLGLSLTGYLLPWDEKGYWATQVATKIMGVAPVLGSALQTLVVGGPVYGHHTLTRFFALHAGLLPVLLTMLLVFHLALFRRHGITHPPNVEGETTFWPDQVLRDAVACLAVLCVILLLVFRHGIGPEGGADLGAPADPSRAYSAARPEWYFLFLFQMLKYFPGKFEVVGAILLPTAVVGLLALFPFIGRLRVGHGFNILVTCGLVATIAGLTAAALWEDSNNDDYKLAVIAAKTNANRTVLLARDLGIPKGGGVELLRQDPKTQGPLLFSENCAVCHRWDGHDGTGAPVEETRDGKTVLALASGPDLAGFGTQDWIRGLLKDPADPDYFGLTTHKDGAMAGWAEENIELMTEDEIEAVAAFLASLAKRTDVSTPDPELVEQGFDVFIAGSEQASQACTDCHRIEYGDEEILFGDLVPAPHLTDYGSAKWMRGIISDPNSPDHYGENNDRMPTFSESLSPEEIDLIIRWMRNEWYEEGQEVPEPPPEAAPAD